MTQQAHLLPQAAIRDATQPRLLGYVEGAVATQEPTDVGVLETGRTDKGFVARLPMNVDGELIARGEERFNIYCSSCHDRAGTGQGVVPQRGFPGPIDLASDNTRRLADGEVFSIITDGVRNMPAMREQIPATDRWPIVAWVRVLQRSQNATIADVDPALRARILPEEISQ